MPEALLTINLQSGFSNNGLAAEAPQITGMAKR